MINRNEIRRGNLVQHDHEGFLTVHNLVGYTIGLFNAENSYFKFVGDDLDGIPLTADILEKAGFAYRNERRGLGSIMDGAKGSVAMKPEDGKFTYLTAWTAPLDFVHQLQNLHFALYGEELQINLQ